MKTILTQLILFFTVTNSLLAFDNISKPSIAAVLNSDGTVQTGRQISGSYNLHGYEMELTKTGMPRFVKIIQNNALIGSSIYDPMDNQMASVMAGWNALTPVASIGVNNVVHALAVSGSNLYVGGAFTTAGGVIVNRVAMWDGSRWYTLGGGVNGMVKSLLVVGPDLYVGGEFTTAGQIIGGQTTQINVNHIARWNITTSKWFSLGTGVTGIMNNIPIQVSALAVDGTGTNLYIGGEFTSAERIASGQTITVNANRIAEWNISTSTWSALQGGMNNLVNALQFIGANLYAAGNFTSANGIPHSAYIAMWNGTNWSTLGTHGLSSNVKCLAAIGTILYVGGQFNTAATGRPLQKLSRIARWDTVNLSWSEVGDGINICSISPCTVQSLTTVNNNLYVGGYMTSVGIANNPTSANHIAVWDGTSWAALDNGTDGIVYALASISTDIFAGGLFANANGGVVNNVAQWH